MKKKRRPEQMLPLQVMIIENSMLHETHLSYNYFQLFVFFNVDLLEHILNDKKMSDREKYKKLVKFRDAYPIIWRHKFPEKDSEPLFMKKFAIKAQKDRFPSLTRLKNAIRI